MFLDDTIPTSDTVTVELTYKGKTLSVYLKNWSLLIRDVSGGFGVLRGRDHSGRRLCQSGESQ